jgi:hypothetical protein
MGVSEVGAVYASQQEYQLYQQDLERIATGMKLKLQSYRANGDLDRLGQRLTPGTPAILLFVGGTPELVQFTQGLEKQQRQRYVVALADVNLQTMTQMGGARSTPVIATQAVPMVNASLPVVRSYRETMARLFDEPPVSLSLAGFHCGALHLRGAARHGRRADAPRRAGRLPAARGGGCGRLPRGVQPAAAQRHLRHPKHVDH